MADLALAYTQGCVSIYLQQDKDLAVRNMGLQLMASADRKSLAVSQAFGAGRLDTAVALSLRLRKSAEKAGNRKRHKGARS